MKRIIGFALLVFLACTQNPHGTIAYRITEKDLIPEGITWSVTTNSFYVSSIYHKKIVKIDAASGVCSDFVTPDVLEREFLGMVVNDDRGHLWACGNLINDAGRYSTVAKFNLATGELLKSYTKVDTARTLFNDLVLDKAGNVYVTNSPQNSLYRIDANNDSLQLFLDSDQLPNPNGITISPDDKYLYVATRDKGIRVIDIAGVKIVNTPDSTIDSNGLDGIKFYTNSIVGVHNGQSVWYVAQYFLDDTGTKITGRRMIDENNPLFNIPTTCVIAANTLYWLANSQMGNMDFATQEIRDPAALVDNLILKKNLGR